MDSQIIIDRINRGDYTNLSKLFNDLPKRMPGINGFSIIDKQDFGCAGILGHAVIENNGDAIMVKGFLYPSESWSPDTHGYVVATLNTKKK